MINVKVGDVLVCKKICSYSSVGVNGNILSTLGEKITIKKINVVDLPNYATPYVIIRNSKGEFNFPIEYIEVYFDTLQDHRRKVIEDLI